MGSFEFIVDRRLEGRDSFNGDGGCRLNFLFQEGEDVLRLNLKYFLIRFHSFILMINNIIKTMIENFLILVSTFSTHL